jgi:hypothetical protein
MKYQELLLKLKHIDTMMTQQVMHLEKLQIEIR